MGSAVFLIFDPRLNTFDVLGQRKTPVRWNPGVFFFKKFRLNSLQSCHVDDKAVLHVSLQHSFIRFLYVPDRDQFDV